MATEGLVPITRAYLAKYYDKYPLPPLSGDVERLSGELLRLSEKIEAEIPLNSDEKLLAEQAAKEPVHKMDENLWRNREQMEEIMFLLEHSRRPKSLQRQGSAEDKETAEILDDIGLKFKDIFKKLVQFQIRNSDNVFKTVMTYMPQDFRGTLIRQQRERSERNKQAEIEALVSAGGTIHDRYALLWRQQMDRRRQLEQLGSASGMYKTVVRYLVGVPQVLLDFVRQINDDNGPMAEQRERYGPSLYALTRMVLAIRLFLHLSLVRYEARKIWKEDILTLHQAANVYVAEFEIFIQFLGEVFVNSPFFITAEEAGSRSADEYKEAVIPAGRTHEVVVTVDVVNSYIAWDFSLQQGPLNSLDIGFHVEYISPSGDKNLILPYKRYENDQGNFCTVSTGSYRLVWDNSYSAFFKKNLRYKVDAVPPVADGTDAEFEDAEPDLVAAES